MPWATMGGYSAAPGISRRSTTAFSEWNRTTKAAGWSGFTMHSLRHFYASGLIAAGCDVVTVQRALGHSTPSITLNTYSHLWPSAEDRTRKAANAIMRDVLATPADRLRNAPA